VDCRGHDEGLYEDEKSSLNVRGRSKNTANLCSTKSR